MSAIEWQPPELLPSELEYAVTTSVLEEFARGHTISEVLRELVQNEYDAGGRSLTVRFTPDGLEVHGNGHPIDRRGWQRLSVMLGTGRAVSAGLDVPAKINGIGSKNHGLRALFLFGDRIYVRSGGRQTVLDLHHGTLRRPYADPTSATRSGAHIFVPYRRTRTGLLEVYDLARERQDVESLSDELAPTLLKLAQPGAPRGLRSVNVSTDRLDRVLRWRQRVKRVGRHRAGGPVLERTVELHDGPASRPDAVARVVEREYQRVLGIPSALISQTYPAYYRATRERLRIGISLRLKRKRPDLESSGFFYYPLGFDEGSTGLAVSVNAPFEMNSDRSALIDPAISSWNDWLIEEAADFTLDLLVHDWLNSFGAAAYLALAESHPHSTPEFAASVDARLRERACWPCRQREPGSRRPTFKAAGDLMLGGSPDLDALMSDGRRLDARLVNSDVAEMARRSGAKDFTVASAVRFRCAGKNNDRLETKLGDDASLYYTAFPGPLVDVERQEAFARAFDTHRQQLTPANRRDLGKARTTLTAAETLAAPTELWLVDETLTRVTPAPATQRLHPRLAKYRTIAGLCQPFDTSAWAREVAEQAVDDLADDEVLEALYRYLVRKPEELGRTTWPALRNAPVVRDHRGDWVAPGEMVQRRAAGASRIEPALHFPSREMVRTPKLLQRLRIRSRLAGADLVRYAAIVSSRPELADEFEETLYHLRRLLTPRTVSTLRTLPFLRSTRGEFVAPEAAYMRTAHLAKCVGPDAEFAAGRHTRLHQRLGCRTRAEADDIVAYLDSLRVTGERPAHPEIIYPELLAALQREGDAADLADQPILFAGNDWHAPSDVLVGGGHRQIFRRAIPVIDAGALDRVYRALGASSQPSSEHWLRFFQWIDERSNSGLRRLSSEDRRVLRAAYSKLDSLPVDVPLTARVFLDTDGGLHPEMDVRNKRFLINDEPRTARAIVGAGLPVAFADASSSPVRRFFVSSGVSLLTDARRQASVRVGDAQRPPPWFKAPHLLQQIRQPAFGSAVHAVAVASGSRTVTPEREFRSRLRRINGVDFVARVEERYRLGSFDFTVDGAIAVDGSRIMVRAIGSRSELYGLLAPLIASMVESTVALQQPLADAVFRLLIAESAGELDRYMEQRGVVWSRRGRRRETDPEQSSENGSQRALIAETLKEELLQPSGRRGPSSAGGASTRGQKPPVTRKRRPLPPLDDVELREAIPRDWEPATRSGGGGKGGSGWSPRSPVEQEEDRELGERGEALIFREELKRARELGYPESRVVWTSRTNPGADHDIQSVADDGGDLWIEVKSTTGRDGKFSWPRSEFELALQEHERYVLCRVYEAHTATPTVRRVPDPVAKLVAGSMRLDISSLAAEVAPLKP